MLLAPSPERLHLDRREPFEPCTQVIGKHNLAQASLMARYQRAADGKAVAVK